MAIQYLALTTMIVLYALMFLGGYISAAGLGLTCPEWPLCPDGIMPGEDYLIEWIHRLVAATTGALVIATMVASFLNKRADKKIKSYSYTLAPPPDQLARDKWSVKGTKIKVELYDDNYVEPDTYFDTIFIDSETKTADGYCLSQRTTRCAEPGQHFDLD